MTITIPLWLTYTIILCIWINTILTLLSFWQSHVKIQLQKQKQRIRMLEAIGPTINFMRDHKTSGDDKVSKAVLTGEKK